MTNVIVYVATRPYICSIQLRQNTMATITTNTVNKVQNNINDLKNMVTRLNEREVKQLKSLNRIRKMNGKQIVSSFAEHRELKSQGL